MPTDDDQPEPIPDDLLAQAEALQGAFNSGYRLGLRRGRSEMIEAVIDLGADTLADRPRNRE